MKRIWLRNANKYTLVSDSDFNILEKIMSIPTGNGSLRRFWYHKSSGYAATKLNGKFTMLHSLLVVCPIGFQIDHRNRNKLDNRRCNLRAVLPKHNVCNRGIQRNNTTGFKGVFFHKKNQNYMARVGRNPMCYLGSFKTKIEAAKAYNVVAKKLYGKFACLNKV